MHLDVTYLIEYDIVEELHNRGSLGLGFLSEFGHVRNWEEVYIIGDFSRWSGFFDLVSWDNAMEEKSKDRESVRATLSSVQGTETSVGESKEKKV
jgi:hypothetical protein